jgi:hypothetical protein
MPLPLLSCCISGLEPEGLRHVAAVEGNGDVLVAAASPDGESPCVISVELGKREVRDGELVSGGNLVGL